MSRTRHPNLYRDGPLRASSPARSKSTGPSLDHRWSGNSSFAPIAENVLGNAPDLEHEADFGGQPHRNLDPVCRANLNTGSQRTNLNIGRSRVGEESPLVYHGRASGHGVRNLQGNGSVSQQHAQAPEFHLFDLQQFVFISLGMPNVFVDRFKCLGTFVAIAVHMVLFMVGVILVISPVFAIEENNSNPELHTAKIISMLVGVFFISLGIYWIVVYCWSRRADVHRHDFSPLALLWWLLSLYFTGLFFSLLTETIDKRIYKGDYLDKNCFGNDRINNVSCYNWIVPSALSSMVLLELVYVVIFCCVTAKRCLDRWREDYVQLP